MSSESHPVSAPTRTGEILRQLGPGLIITATIVGSGELVVTPKLGAGAGFTLLWFMIAACVLKVFIQVEIGRHTVTTGSSSLRTMDRMPGPRLRGRSWLLWLWVPMFIATVFQIAGMLGGVASILSLAGVGLPKPVIATGVGVLTAVLLVVGRYKVIEVASTWMVVAFTLCTMVAVGALQFTPFAVTGANLAEGFSFKLPPSFTVAFAAFGVIGVGASELIYYPYWLLEKGYSKRVGDPDGSPAWRERARGWIRVLHADVWTSCLIYTGATLAFYVLGAAILKKKGLDVTNADMIPTLSQMYIETFGAWSLWLFLIGAAAVLYSTVFGATAANVRLVADALEVFGAKTHRDEADRQRTLRWLSIAFPVIWTVIFLLWGEPVTLVFVGAIAQGLMLPFLGFLALHLHHRHTPEELKPGAIWRSGLWLSAACMTVAGGYQVITRLLP
jgi:Mn2+/Fe2+ NRAMP family transporter